MVKTAKNLSSKSWEALCVEWSQSGLSQKAFCAQRGVDYKVFVNWRVRNKAIVARVAARATAATPQKSNHQLIPIRVVGSDFSQRRHQRSTVKALCKHQKSAGRTSEGKRWFFGWRWVPHLGKLPTDCLQIAYKQRKTKKPAIF